MTDDKQAATAELTKLCKTLHRLGMVQNYTTEFNTITACTNFSDYNKQECCCTGLPYKIQSIFTQGAHDIDNIKKIQKAALSIDQALAIWEEERPKQFGWKRKAKRQQLQAQVGDPSEVPATIAVKKDTACPNAPSLKPTKVKVMEEKITALMVADNKEGFWLEPHWMLYMPALVVIVIFLH